MVYGRVKQVRSGRKGVLNMSPVRKTSLGRRIKSEDSREQGVPTPRRDLIVVRVGPTRSRAKLSDKEMSSTLIRGIAEATRKPGIQRSAIFRNRTGKQVYAYSVYPRDITKIIQEGQNGKRTFGRFVKGQFKALRAKTTQWQRVAPKHPTQPSSCERLPARSFGRSSSENFGISG